ncbi:MAG: DUF3943 domain-containing protein [Candidatus Azobacteroides sp.]|nr:DUF3943 domain-containing protein [Candidatus Azobacteroides sp.]
MFRSSVRYIFPVILIFSLSINHAFALVIRTDSMFYDSPTDSISTEFNRTKQEIPNDIYKRPYSFWENNPDYKRLKTNAIIVFGSSFIAAGILYLMPEKVSNWNKEEMSMKTIFSDWWKHVSEGPVIDRDDWILNYISHPYFGAVYYMGARSAGLSAPYSFLYSIAFSSFFWEYGIEAFAEVPSVQDLIITPVCGSILGEGFYLAKREIVAHDHRLLNSPILGHTVTFLMDPINEVMDLCTGKFKKKKKNTGDILLTSYPVVQPSGKLTYSISLNISF